MIAPTNTTIDIYAKKCSIILNLSIYNIVTIQDKTGNGGLKSFSLSPSPGLYLLFTIVIVNILIGLDFNGI